MDEADDAAGGRGDVQCYLDEHRITSLFENLMSKIVKERPADPIEFLIGKLLAIQRQKKKSASPAHSGSLAFGARSKIQVTGKSVTPKCTATAKAKSAEQLVNSAGGRPMKPRARGVMSSSTSALKKATPSKTMSSPVRPVTSSGLKTSTSTSKGTSPVSRRPTTAPGTSRAASSPAGRGSLAAVGAVRKETKPPSSSLLGKSSAASGTSSATKSARDKEKAVVAKKSSQHTATEIKEGKGKDKKLAKNQRQLREASAEQINEFFGEARKSSTRQLRAGSEGDSDIEEFAGRERRDSYSDESGGMESDPMDEVKSADFDLEELIQKRLRSRCGKKSHDKVHSLLCPSLLGARPSSLGYHSESQGERETSSGESEALEYAEDYAVLEDEGVTRLSRGKYTFHKVHPSSSSAKVDLKVVICSQCARVIADGEPLTEVTASQLTQTSSRSLEGDFESASQVGGQSFFPQWEASSALSGSETADDSNCRSHDLSSDVTLQSCDTWGGLAPPTRMHPIPSDTDSELQLPPPLPLEGKTWLQEQPTQHDPHGWSTTH